MPVQRAPASNLRVRQSPSSLLRHPLSNIAIHAAHWLNRAPKHARSSNPYLVKFYLQPRYSLPGKQCLAIHAALSYLEAIDRAHAYRRHLGATMSHIRATVLAGALIASAATTVTAPDARAQVWVEGAFFSNQSGNVKCELVHSSTGETFTLCVSDIARAIQPECNPPEHLIPAVRIEPNYVGTMCWNQGFPCLLYTSPSPRDS